MNARMEPPMPRYLCEGTVTRYVTMWVDAKDEEEAKRKVRDGDLVREKDGDVHDVNMDYETLRVDE
jgi:hypothetical protein